MTRSLAAVPAAALGVALMLSGCAERSDAGAAAPPTTESPAEPAPTAQLPAEGLVLQVAQKGGFVTPEMLAARLPMVSVHADGRVISTGPVPAIYPGPAWPNMQVQQADPSAVRSLVDAALAAGVAEDTDLGSPPVADATTTRFTVTTAEGTAVREVYALYEGEGVGTGLSADQQQARQELAELAARLTDLPLTLGPEGTAPASYEPDAVAAIVRPWTATEDDGLPDDQQALPVQPWPGPALPGEPLGPGITCVLATGEQARSVQQAALGATTLTPWRSEDGALWSVTFRPLLPGEAGCADLAG